MLRDKNLIPLSHQHQHALALCVRIDRASPVPATQLDAWQGEVEQHFRGEIAIHFGAEERHVFPAAREYDELDPLVDDLLADHAWLRDRFAKAESRAMSASELSEFAQRLSAHIRKEERYLFERLQELMTQEDLAQLGRKLDEALRNATIACALPAQPPRKLR